MKKKKILFVINSIQRGGAEKILQYLLKGIDRELFEIYLFLLFARPNEKGLIPEDVTFSSSTSKGNYLSILIKLVRFIIQTNPDLIFSLLWGANILSAFAALLTNHKLFAGEYTIPSVCMKQYSFPFLRKKILGSAYRTANKIIACSETSKKDISNFFGIQAENIVMIKNGIDVQNIKGLSNENVGVPYNDYFISVGRLEKEKNFAGMIENIYNLRTETGINFPLVIVGEGSLHKELEEKAAALKIRIYMPGFLSNPYPFIKKAKIFLLTSSFESLPLNILEAMVCGTPVIAEDCPGGINEVIENNKTGIIIPKNNPKAFSESVKRLLNDDSFRRLITENAYSAVTRNFSLPAMIEKYNNLLNEQVPK